MNESSSDKPEIVIIGGGLAGLSVARELLVSGTPCRVTVLEKGDRPGGMAISLQIGGLLSDLGPHRLYSTIPDMREWFWKVLGDRMFVVRRRSRMFVDGRFLSYPPRPLEILRTYGPARIARMAWGYGSARCKGWLGRLRPTTFGSAMELQFGRPACETLFFPYIRKVWRVDPDEISVEASRVRATMGSAAKVAWRMMFPTEKSGQETTVKKFHYLKGGIETLARHLTLEIMERGGEVICQAEATRIRLESGRVISVEYRDGEGLKHIQRADFAFSTMALPDLVHRISGAGAPRNEAIQAADRLEFLKTIFVYVVLDRPSLSEDTWLYYFNPDSRIIRLYEPKNFDASLAPKNRTLICIEATSLGDDDPEWHRSDEEIATDYIAQAVQSGLFDSSEVVETQVRRLPLAYPLYRVGYQNNLHEIWKSLRGIGNLISLGRQGLFQHNNMDHTIHTGRRAARCWLEESDPVGSWFHKEMPTFSDFRIVD